MKIFLTGATGFIGSHGAHHLLEAGHEPVVVARDASKAPSLTEVASAASALRERPGVRMVVRE